MSGTNGTCLKYFEPASPQISEIEVTVEAGIHFDVTENFGGTNNYKANGTYSGTFRFSRRPMSLAIPADPDRSHDTFYIRNSGELTGDPRGEDDVPSYPAAFIFKSLRAILKTDYSDDLYGFEEGGADFTLDYETNGDADSIQLSGDQDMMLVLTVYQALGNPLVTASDVVAGKRYQIETIGETDWTECGGINEVGHIFRATAGASGNGTARNLSAAENTWAYGASLGSGYYWSDVDEESGDPVGGIFYEVFDNAVIPNWQPAWGEFATGANSDTMKINCITLVGDSGLSAEFEADLHEYDTVTGETVAEVEATIEADYPADELWEMVGEIVQTQEEDIPNGIPAVYQVQMKRPIRPLNADYTVDEWDIYFRYSVTVS